MVILRAQMENMNNRIDRTLLDSIYLGDCRELLAGTASESVDLVVSSPPYNLGKEYEKKGALQVYLDGQRSVLKECARVLKRSGSLFWQIGSFSNSGILIPLDIKLFPTLEDLGLLPRNRIAWVRQHGMHARKKFSCRYETILWFTKSDDYVFNLDPIRVPQKYQNKKSYRGNNKGQLSCNPAGKNPGDIWAFRNVKHNHEEQTIHPCQFPEDLIARIVLSTTNLGAIVLDPYMGSGTVAVVARDLGRRYIGAEKNPKYYDVALRRLNGGPDERNTFPNLKTLRDYVERTGDPIELYRFDVQVGKRATERHKARIYPESHHVKEIECRLSVEELAFGAKLRGGDQPADPPLNSISKRRDTTSGVNFKLFDT